MGHALTLPRSNRVCAPLVGKHVVVQYALDHVVMIAGNEPTPTI